ncbi:MAG: Uma2 family endonuclease [Ignavibacteria bacterium]|nr:Uma2 family endonuclease [Ignavibacteria bacterium]
MSKVNLNYLPQYTYEDYENWEGKWELINGIPYAMSPAPGFQHQKISGKIHIQLDKLLKNCKNCQALIPMDWRIPSSKDNTVLQPDNFILCGIPGEKFITKTPVLIFEILSPSTAYKDRHLKYEVYETNGVKYYIIVDIENKSADVFELKNNKYVKTIEAKNDIVNFILEDDCSVKFNFKEIWI